MIEKIVSGGQTGADRAALDWAMKRGIPHGGWCPKGRRAEDGTIPGKYHMQEMPSASYPKRTEQNVIDSDGTVIFTISPVLSGGSKKTAEYAKKRGRPFIHISQKAADAGQLLRNFVQENGIKILNVAGPRASNEPAVAEFVIRVLNEALPKAR